MNLYPLKLKYTAKTALWGGTTLKKDWGKHCDFDKLAETWELTVRQDAVNLVTNGDYAGKTLADFLSEYPGAIAEGKVFDHFPLLIKLIDAEDRLSVQVHPDDAYACAHEKDPGKTEMWHIVSAAENAEIIYGLRSGISSDGFRRYVAEGKIGEAVHTVRVHAGETYFIPSGMLHAIGCGCLIAEIQQNSDLTYRVYDYDRIGADGKPRELHVDKAMDVVTPFTQSEVDAIRFSEKPVLANGDCLASCRYFEVHRINLGGYSMDSSVGADSFHSLLCIGGNGQILCGGESYPIARGDSYFLPAGLGKYTLCGNAKILLSRL